MPLLRDLVAHKRVSIWQRVKAVAPCSVLARLTPQEELCLIISGEPGLMSSELTLHYVTRSIGSPGNARKALLPRPRETPSIFKMLEWHFWYFLFNLEKMKIGKQDLHPGMRTWQGGCSRLLCLGLQLGILCVTTVGEHLVVTDMVRGNTEPCSLQRLLWKYIT